MKTRLLIVLLAALTGAVVRLPGQTPAPPRPTPPPGPLLNKAPDFAAWTVVSQRAPATPGAADARPPTGKGPEMVTTVTKTNQTRHFVIRHRVKKTRDGGQEEIWQQGPYVVTHESMWQAAQLGFENTREDTAAADFPEFGWISEANFVGVQSVEGAACLVFDATITIGGKPESGDGTSKTTDRNSGGRQVQVHERAYIDQDTRLPRVLISADMVSRYTFQDAPGDPLALPVPDQEMINAYLKNNAARLRAPQPP